MFVEIKRGGVTMYTNNQLEVIHLQDSYTIMYALLAREIMNALGEKGERIVREATEAIWQRPWSNSKRKA